MGALGPWSSSPHSRLSRNTWWRQCSNWSPRSCKLPTMAPANMGSKILDRKYSLRISKVICIPYSLQQKSPDSYKWKARRSKDSHLSWNHKNISLSRIIQSKYTCKHGHLTELCWICRLCWIVVGCLRREIVRLLLNCMLIIYIVWLLLYMTLKTIWQPNSEQIVERVSQAKNVKEDENVENN